MLITNNKIHVWCLFLLCIFAFSDAQHQSVEKYVSTQWGLKEGLPQSSVNDLVQSRDGYIWLATFSGLVRFNGESFTTYNRSNSIGLQSDRFLNLFEDRRGFLWCSTEDGFSQFKDGLFRTYNISNSVFNYAPRLITEDGRGMLWISVNEKLFRFDNDSFLPTSVLHDSHIVKAALENRSGAWIAHGKDLIKTIGDSAVRIKNFSELFTYKFESVVEDKNSPGVVWIGTSGSGVIRYNTHTDEIRQYTAADGLPSRYIREVYFDHSNNLFTSGFNGISKFNGERFVPLQTVEGVNDHEYNEIIQDREGNYWAGSPSFGLRRLRPSVIKMISDDEGLTEGKMLSLVRRKNGTFLFGTNCGGIYEYSNGKAVHSSINSRLINLCVWSIFEDSKERLWIGSRILMRFDSLKGKGVLFDSAKGFNGLDIFAITEDSKGRVWVGCLNGLFMYDGVRFHQFTKADGLTYNDVRSLFEDASGTMWIGTSNGLNKFRNGVITQVPLTVSKGSSKTVLSSYVRAIYQDAAGAMWFGTYGGGILRLKDGHFTAITTANGLGDNIVSHIYECQQGYFWMGNNRGIMRVRKEDLNNVADGKKNKLHSYYYGTLDGMASPETNGGFQPSIAHDGKGNLYFPTVEGVAVVATTKVRENKVIPSVQIEKIQQYGNEIARTDDIILEYGNTDLEIEYASLSYVDPSKNFYRYMIEGVDRQWIDVGNRNKAYYTNIPSGEWTFRVIASNNDGVWNETGDSLKITIKPPFWQTWWFYSLVGLFFLSAGPSIYYIRITQLKKERLRQQLFAERLIDSQEKERRRIAMELHDGLGQQILIMKNRAELALKEVSNSERTAEQLREIVDSATTSINDVRIISHGLRPVHLEQFGLTDTVNHLCEQLQASSNIMWSVHVDNIDELIPREKQINFYRILQEGTNNILRHSSATQASIMIRYSENILTASLWDNGKGFDPEQKSQNAGMGLSGMMERVYTLDGTCEVKSSPNEGTTIKIIIPIPRHG